ncbi:hypothetical protein COU60_00280 [Candidatus Pacearchaeota archaeon CG10_big_fil_rev_8_21_14_0_10_34_76]|nr:MAG: hypothetical protein COU60_00280 [Candidatus Pacearchaeota archaeon CG10_big_fil_rev_8_21_14_0_10_34_76]
MRKKRSSVFIIGLIILVLASIIIIVRGNELIGNAINVSPKSVQYTSPSQILNKDSVDSGSEGDLKNVQAENVQKTPKALDVAAGSSDKKGVSGVEVGGKTIPVEVHKVSPGFINVVLRKFKNSLGIESYEASLSPSSGEYFDEDSKSNLPNLIVSELAYIVSETVGGKRIDVSVIIKNIGGEYSEENYFVQKLCTSGEPCIEKSINVPSLNAGESKTFLEIIYLGDKEYALSVEIDPLDNIKESNEKNNKASLLINA